MNDTSYPSEYTTGNSSTPLLNVCIAFAIAETFFIIAFLFSWYYNSATNINFRPVSYCVLIGYIFCFGGVVLGILQITMGGAGYHAETLRPETVITMRKLVKAHEFVYVSSILFPKLAILYLYLRLFASRTMHAVIYGTAVLVIATFLFGLFASVFNCRPFSAFWNRKLEMHCGMNAMAVFRFYSIPNIASDAILILIPFPALHRVRVGLLSKIGLYLTFLLMTFGIITAVLRFVSFLNVDLFQDITYLCVTTTSWTVIEPGVYLIAATMPTLRPLVRRIFRQANTFCPSPSHLRSCFRPYKSQGLSQTITEPKRVVHKKSSRSLHRDLFDSIGRRPSRAIQLDDYHYFQDPAVMSLRSMDEESLVCADARSQELLARQGRNPDGTLRIWSLQPVSLSPLRTSFLYANS